VSTTAIIVIVLCLVIAVGGAMATVKERARWHHQDQEDRP